MDYTQLIGKRLVENVMAQNGLLLYPAGVILTDKHIELLQNFNIPVDEVLAEEVQDLPDFSTETEPELETSVFEEAAREVFHSARSGLRDLEEMIMREEDVPIQEVQEKFIPAMIEATEHQNLYKLLSLLKDEGDFRYTHSMGVTVMAVKLGRWLGLDDEEMSLLATAASLCDIGSIRLPGQYLYQSAHLLPHEKEIIKHHTVLGYELLQKMGADERVARVALQHHERCDGSGYPNGLRGEDIDKLAKIVMLADVYVAMTSARPYRAPLPLHEVFNTIYDGIINGEFDTHFGMVFLNRLMNAQVGSEVILSDQRKGTILIVNPNHPTSPLISLGDDVIDLGKDTTVSIQEIIG